MSFVAPTVQGEIKRHFRDHTRPVHVPRSAQELRARVLAGAAARVWARPGALRALATDVGLDDDEVDVVLRTERVFCARQIDAPTGEDGLLQRQIAQRVGMSQMQVSRRLVVIADALEGVRRPLEGSAGPRPAR